MMEPESLQYTELSFSNSLNREQQEQLHQEHQHQLQLMASLPRIGRQLMAVEYATIGQQFMSSQESNHSSTMSPSLSSISHQESPLRSVRESNVSGGSRVTVMSNSQGSPKFESTV